MPELSRSRLHALSKVAEGKVYRPRSEDFHPNPNEHYVPRSFWRERGNPKAPAQSMYSYLEMNEYIKLDEAGEAVLAERGVEALRLRT